MIRVPTRFGTFAPRLVPTLAMIGAVILLANLSAWQLRRHAYKNRHRDAMLAAVDLAEVELNAASEPSTLLFRAVKVTGTFEPPVMLEGGRTVDYVGGYGLLQPLRTPDGLRLLVDRGELRREGMEDALARIAAQPGPVTVTGQLRPLPLGEPKPPIASTAPPIWGPRGIPGIHAHAGDVAPGVYLRLGPPMEASERPRRDPEVQPDLATGYIAVVKDNSSAHYAKQWAAIAGVAMLLWLWASLERVRQDPEPTAPAADQ